jgi:hypothetical protein
MTAPGHDDWAWEVSARRQHQFPGGAADDCETIAADGQIEAPEADGEEP